MDRARRAAEPAELRLERLGPEHLEAVVELARGGFAHAWSRESFEQELRRPETRGLLARDERGLAVAYALAWLVLDELHLLSVVTAAAWRRRGVARRLVSELLAQASAEGVRLVWLEVRVGNQAARELYARLGFVQVAVRPRYYPDTGEDALVLLRELVAQEHQGGGG